MGFHNRLFRLASWIRATTSYILPIIDETNDPSSGIEAGEGPDIELAHDQSVTLARKSKVCFYVFYASLLMLYLVLVLVTACKYPFKPEPKIKTYLPVFDKRLDNITEEMKQAINLNISFHKRNRLMTSVTYDDLNINIAIFYLDPYRSEYVAVNINPEFSQYQPSPKEINVRMRAPGLPGLYDQLRKELTTRMYVQVNLEITAGFRCGSLCKNKQRFRDIVWGSYIEDQYR